MNHGAKQDAMGGAATARPGAGARPAHEPSAHEPSGQGRARASGPIHAPARRARDLRLDFFRGLAMFIILLAHTPGNPWTLWIPARFGFSDATEIFVFCSGLASALAFGSAFRDRGFGLGSARIGFRVWQVYWAHVGLVIAVTALMALFDASGLGPEGKRYLGSLPLIPWETQFSEAVIGLLTLTWVPNYFDILPMYLAILAMVPLVMGAHRLGGRWAVAALVWGLWAVAQTGALDLPSRPWRDDLPWFFNPFGWQLVFFTGFAFGMRWLPAPPRSRALGWAAAAFLVLSLPFAWWKLHQGVWLPEGALADAAAAGREALQPLWAKTPQGLLRWVHFLALGYLAWMWAGEKGEKLSRPLALPGAATGRRLALIAAAAALTAPYALAQEIRAIAPPLDAAVLALYGDLPRALFDVDLLAGDRWIGILQILNGAALVALGWSLAPAAVRDRVRGPGWALLVELVRRVGSQSLAVFLTSMALAQAMGFAVDLVGSGVWVWGALNLAGFGALILTATVVGWFKRQPWRGQAPRAAHPPAAASSPAPGAAPVPAE
ncbi:OpgC family protein [Rhodovulum sp. DZ06]|uniref:OpgC family protein n=1 Tax=Rhodovulum sp. DZ06 TaxID=3425126 RepID=UPI003D351700